MTGKRRIRGFTLVEVMMAIAVMTVGAIAIFSMQNVTATASRRARIVSTATEVNRFWMDQSAYQGISATQGMIFLAVVRFLLTTPGLAYFYLDAERLIGDTGTALGAAHTTLQPPQCCTSLSESAQAWSQQWPPAPRRGPWSSRWPATSRGSRST